ncbi:MAG: DUF4270 domain-containing protein [Bacteroidales bacterium]|jgi:hypothetical protein|nr:DUF4270 domain-containing protein [Bacteroidales bacterium]MDD3700017.1 DUF4270 domain-containing protein [Bacteroidales bacterium]MDY0368789.1 DUF4270 domain-containing protein [Bacteroidales bacterium]
MPSFIRKDKHRVGILCCLLIAGLFFQACTKKPGLIGDTIQPDTDLIKLKYTDSLTITAYSLLEDSIRTDKPENFLLGSIYDPVFGTTVAGFYTQFSLSTRNPDFGSNPQLDSLVLQMAYSGYYGDTNTFQTIRVYELEENIFYDSAYYSNRILTASNTELANFSFKPKPNSKVHLLKDTVAPMLQVRLDALSTELGNKLLTATADNMLSDTAFKNFFKGLYLTADPVTNGGAISMFNLPVNLSRLIIYYKNSEKDSLQYDYTISSVNAGFNVFNHFGYQNADPEFIAQVLGNDTLSGSQKLYLQGGGGVKVRLKFPDLPLFEATTNDHIIINDAKLIFTGLHQDTATFLAPIKLSLVQMLKDEKYQILEDQGYGTEYFGGEYIPRTNQYQFHITRYMQEAVNQRKSSENFGLQLSVLGAASRPNRIVINGTNPIGDSTTKLKLVINYTLVNN